MLNLIRYVSILIVFIFASCSASVDSDAKKAAELTRQSLDYTAKRELGKAEEAFEQSKLIRDKYIDSSEEFYELYTKYLAN